MPQIALSLLVFSFVRTVISADQPAPILVKPSGNFSGNDGSWGTFNVGAGTPPQMLQLLPSTQVPESWVVLAEGCTTSDPKNCSVTRGNTFNYGASSTWDLQDTYSLQSEANLGYTTNSDNGAYGWDNLTLATIEGASVSMNHSVVAGIATKDFYLGILGLASRDIVWQDKSGSSPSLIRALHDQNLIPKQSYGYTAGASYNDAPPSLTIGGYDESRLTPNDISFAFGSSPVRQLLVVIQGISVTNSNAEPQLVDSAIFALVDSTVPHLWLPASVCDAFEKAFGISYDPISNLYLVNETQHDAMVKQEAEVTFQLGTSLNGGSTVNVTLPYASFDLEVGPPLVKSQRRYFPLKRAKDETQYTLGRTFLQEAFIHVDYDNNEFFVYQAQYNSGTPSHILVTSAASSSSTPNPGSTPVAPAVAKSTGNSSSGIGTGAIAGIVVVVVVLVLAAAGFCLWWFRFRNRKGKNNKYPKDRAELEGNEEQKGVHEAYGKRRLSSQSAHETKKGGDVDVNEVEKTPPAELQGEERFGAPSPGSMSIEQVGLAELPSPDPYRPELESPGLAGIRSELSTPEPRSELSTADPTLVPELTSQELAHEMSANRNSHRRRPHAFRENSVGSDILHPNDSASIRLGAHERKISEDTFPSPQSPNSRKTSQRLSLGPRRPSGLQRAVPVRVNSSSSHDTFQTRIDETSATQSHPQGGPSPLASPPLGTQPSPSLSGLNSPTFQHRPTADSGPPTPGFDISEKEPLMHQPQHFRTKFAENLSADPEPLTAQEKHRREEAPKAVVRDEVEKLERRKQSG
ncbi:MAG: hypothetical protein Q9222_003758 [Ikaeria aurantiellina]